MSDDPGLLLSEWKRFGRFVGIALLVNALALCLGVIVGVCVSAEPLTLEQRVERLEKAVFPEAKRIPLTVKDGQFYEGDKVFRDVSATIAGDACNQSDAMLETMFDRLAACGCRLIRVLHVAIDDKLPPSQYQPNMAEWRAGFKMYDRLVVQAKKRGMLIWINLHHRQRLSLDEAKALGCDDTLFAPQPVAGEIGTAFLVIPSLEKFVGDYCVELASRYKDEPTVALVTIANEKVRYPGYHISQRGKTDAVNKSYRDEWFRRFTEFQKLEGVTDKDTHAVHVTKFHAYNAVQVYRRIYKRLRDAGVKCPIGMSNGSGDCRMDVLPILAAGDFIDWHSYGFVTSALPDPFEPNDVRDLSSIQRVIRCKGMPCVLGEHADVNEGKKLMLPGYLLGPKRATDAGFDVSNHYCAWLGPIGFGKEYNGGDVPGFLDALKDARLGLSPERNEQGRVYIKLTEKDLFGAWEKIDGVWKDTPPPIVGCADDGQDGVMLPDSVKAWIQ